MALMEPLSNPSKELETQTHQTVRSLRSPGLLGEVVREEVGNPHLLALAVKPWKTVWDLEMLRVQGSSGLRVEGSGFGFRLGKYSD